MKLSDCELSYGYGEATGGNGGNTKLGTTKTPLVVVHKGLFDPVMYRGYIISHCQDPMSYIDKSVQWKLLEKCGRGDF